MGMVLRCEAFDEGQPIPKKYTGDGKDISPPFTWQGEPAGTWQYALICDDPDAPSPQPWVHWLIYRISHQTRSLPEGIPPTSRVQSPITACQGRNSWSSGRTIGYRGPAPPPRSGTHHYHFTLYALDAEIEANPGVDKTALQEVMSGHILAEATLIGTYE